MKVIFTNSDKSKTSDQELPNLLKYSSEAYKKDRAYYEASGITETAHKKLFFQYYDQMFGYLYK